MEKYIGGATVVGGVVLAGYGLSELFESETSIFSDVIWMGGGVCVAVVGVVVYLAGMVKDVYEDL